MSRHRAIEWVVIFAIALVWAFFAGRECGADPAACAAELERHR